MDSVVTKYPVEIVTDEKVEETDCMLAAGEVNFGRVEAPASSILKQFVTIEWLSGHVSITWGDFRITVPEK